MSDIILKGGKLRERVKSGEVSSKEARKALLTLKRQGEVVSEPALRWLNNFRPRNTQVEGAPSQKKLRRKQRRQ